VQKNLVRDVEAMTQLLRNPAHLHELNQAADYIRKEWEKLGLTVTEQPFMFQGKPFKNLIVSLGPAEAERLVIGAHHDVNGDQPGADDNASGVAGMLELTRLLVKHQPTLKNRIDLVAYTLEEQYPDSIGSKVHAQSLKQQGIPVRGMISIEMIGYYSDQPYSQNFPSKLLKWIYPTTGNFIGLIGYGNAFNWLREVQSAFQNTTLPARKLYVPFNMLGVDRSDHSNFTRQGIPALMITDTSNFRNPNYHQASDTIGTLDFNRMAEVVKGLYNLLTR
jgi:Zn-dependent M28 family amino/carboxypeptidase